jgi:hypothetical protein
MQMQSLFGGTTARTLGSLAATALMAIAAPAQAVVVVYAGPPIPIVANIDGLYLNVVTGANDNGFVAGWDINLYNNDALSTVLSFWAPTGGGYVGAGTQVSVLAPGASVGPASTFLTTPNIQGGYGSTSFAGTTSYFGFRFVNESGGTTHYGWAQLDAGGDGGFPASIIQYAYESTANTAITVVPAPGTYAMMALGLAAMGGLVARRRKQDQAS